jgi:hypothetical protein
MPDAGALRPQAIAAPICLLFDPSAENARVDLAALACDFLQGLAQYNDWLAACVGRSNSLF